METNQMTHEKSLELISTTIMEAKQTLKSDGSQYLFWGLMGIGCALVNLIGIQIGQEKIAYNIWLAMFFLGVPLHFFIFRKQTTRVRSIVQNSISNIYFSYGIALFVGIFCLLAMQKSPIPVVLLLTGFVTFYVGRLVKFIPLVLGGGLFFVGAIITSINTDNNFHLIVYIVVMFLGYIVPGILLKRQS